MPGRGHVRLRRPDTFAPSGGNDIFNSGYLIVMLTNSDRYSAEDIVPDIAHEIRRIQR